MSRAKQGATKLTLTIVVTIILLLIILALIFMRLGSIKSMLGF